MCGRLGADADDLSLSWWIMAKRSLANRLCINFHCTLQTRSQASEAEANAVNAMAAAAALEQQLAATNEQVTVCP